MGNTIGFLSKEVCGERNCYVLSNDNAGIQQRARRETGAEREPEVLRRREVCIQVLPPLLAAEGFVLSGDCAENNTPPF
jgi:hypothetical protein